MKSHKKEAGATEYLWNDFETFSKNFKEFRLGIGLLQNNKLKAAKGIFVSQLKNSEGAARICLYKLLALIHFLKLEYFESVFYLKKGADESCEKTYFFFLECLWFVERYGRFHGPCPRIKINEELFDKGNEIENNFENKYMLNNKLANNYYFQIKFCKNYYGEKEFKENIVKAKKYFGEYSILCVYLYKGRLQVYDTDIIMEVEIDWDEVNNELNKILNENKEILGRSIRTDEEKKIWWMKRYELDGRMERLIRRVRSRMKLNLKEKIICVFDENTIGFPFEKVFQRITFRISSLECLFNKRKQALLESKTSGCNHLSNNTITYKSFEIDSSLTNSNDLKIDGGATNNKTTINNEIITEKKINKAFISVASDAFDKNTMNDTTNKNIISLHKINGKNTTNTNTDMANTTINRINTTNKSSIFVKTKDESDLLKTFYLLDAENNLISTQKCISVFIEEYMNNMIIDGVCGRRLNKQEMEKINYSELFMFFGHGSGRKYFNLEKIMPHMAFLFGCSSCKLLSVKNFKYNGHLLNHLNKGRTILGTLWEVTDKDLDRFTISFLKDFFKKRRVGEAIKNNSKNFKMTYLNGAAMVIYGLPDV